MDTVIDAPDSSAIPASSIHQKIQRAGGTGSITIDSYTPVVGANLQFSTDGST